ncbi:MAG: AAA family ATPase [Chitinispirillales bacterium]|nr:AAA family ATPase [Chitinispirillales bacterium]
MSDGYIKRKIDDDLLEWARDDRRKPLLIRGARQVGKSCTVRNLGKQFKYFVEVNFERERDKEAKDLFAKGGLSVQELSDELARLYNTPIIPGETLLFLDEIQASIPAISSLRYFYEEYRELHIIAAGSLLEFALAELPSFGVGRIRSMFMYPLSFFEFLNACHEHDLLLQAVKKANFKKPLSEPVHKTVIKYLKNFLILGGMPEVVYTYANTGNSLKCQQVLDDLIISLRSDFAKYKKKVPASQISAVFDSVVTQMGKKFVYTNVSEDYAHRQLKEALELLVMAGLVIPVTHTAANKIPLGAEKNIKKQKMLMLDTGIFQRLLGLPMSDLVIYDDFSVVNKGCIAELLVGLELLKAGSPYEQKELYYWHRESKSSNAEIDYIVQSGQNIIPIEVKSGTKGAMQSMRVFLKEKNSPYGIRTSLENYGEIPDIRIIPVYGVGADSFLDG